MHTGMLVLAMLIVRQQQEDSKAAGVEKLKSFAKEGQSLGSAEWL